MNVYDLTEGKKLDIPEGSWPGPVNSNIPIYDSKIVWSCEGYPGNNISVHDISTNKTTLITTNGYSPDIYENKIVYVKSYRSEYYPYTSINSVWLYDLTTNKETQITENDTTGIIPVIWGNKIAWLRIEADYKTNIFIYDIPTHQISTISTNVTLNGLHYIGDNLDIYENVVVWTNNRDIYMLDISTDKTTQITNNGISGSPVIYGNLIVYQTRDNINGGFVGDIYMYNISTGKTTPITNCSCAWCPSIYNNKIVYADYHASDNLDLGWEGGSIYLYDLSAEDSKPTANFTTNITSGVAPLTALFTDTSTGSPISWYWDFGDGINSKHAMNATHTFTKPGNYTVSLIVGNNVGNNTTTKLGYIVVTDRNAPVADFNSNVTEGYAPLTVQFNDTSLKTTSRIWDFNSDGQTDSSDRNPVYMYSNTGIYTVNLTVSNDNGTASKTASINVLTPSSSSGDSSSGSSHSSSSSGGGGASGSPEPAKNVEVKELSQAFITNGKPVKFDFPKNATCVVYVSFDAKKTFGKTTTIAEQLKGKSALVSGLPEGEVYKSFNVWVGNGGVATSKNIENPVVCFKVEKAWVKDKKIDQGSITLNRYSDKKWEQFSVNLSGEDDKYLYFTSKTSGFSSFAVTGTVKSSEETVTGIQLASNETINENNSVDKEPQNQQKEILKIPGFEVYYGVASLFAVLLYKRK